VHRGSSSRRRPRQHALHGGLGTAQHARAFGQADQFERAHALVQLRARRAQHGRVDGVEVGAPATRSFR
jgi:hypothetical protein